MHAGATCAWRVGGDGVTLRVRLTPKSTRDAIEGAQETAEGKALKARVRAPPAGGAANAALERVIAAWLGVPRTAVAVISGGKSRIKMVKVQGPPDTMGELIARKLVEFGG